MQHTTMQISKSGEELIESYISRILTIHYMHTDLNNKNQRKEKVFEQGARVSNFFKSSYSFFCIEIKSISKNQYYLE